MRINIDISIFIVIMCFVFVNLNHFIIISNSYSLPFVIFLIQITNFHNYTLPQNVNMSNVVTFCIYTFIFIVYISISNGLLSLYTKPTFSIIVIFTVDLQRYFWQNLTIIKFFSKNLYIILTAFFWVIFFQLHPPPLFSTLCICHKLNHLQNVIILPLPSPCHVLLS